MTRLERPHSKFLDARLGEQIPVLDKGFVRVIDYMGDEAAIVQAARVSYGEGTKTVSTDRGLIRYLMRNWHTSPLEMCELKIHVKLPIFVARQWIRHRQASVNEVSGRYSVLSDEVYIPDVDRLQAQSKDNKQGSGDVLDADTQRYVLRLLEQNAEHAYDTYESLVESDLARELARIGLTVSHYTEWYWKIDLHNLLHFLSLRAHAHAQKETRDYADVIFNLVQGWVPAVADAFVDYRLGAHTFSRQEMTLIRDVMKGVFRKAGPPREIRQWMKADADRFDLGTKRERKAFWEATGVLGLLEEIPEPEWRQEVQLEMFDPDLETSP